MTVKHLRNLQRAQMTGEWHPSCWEMGGEGVELEFIYHASLLFLLVGPRNKTILLKYDSLKDQHHSTLHCLLLIHILYHVFALSSSMYPCKDAQYTPAQVYSIHLYG